MTTLKVEHCRGRSRSRLRSTNHNQGTIFKLQSVARFGFELHLDYLSLQSSRISNSSSKRHGRALRRTNPIGHPSAGQPDPHNSQSVGFHRKAPGPPRFLDFRCLKHSGSTVYPQTVHTSDRFQSNHTPTNSDLYHAIWSQRYLHNQPIHAYQSHGISPNPLTAGISPYSPPHLAC